MLAVLPSLLFLTAAVAASTTSLVGLDWRRSPQQNRSVRAIRPRHANERTTAQTLPPRYGHAPNRSLASTLRLTAVASSAWDLASAALSLVSGTFPTAGINAGTPLVLT